MASTLFTYNPPKGNSFYLFLSALFAFIAIYIFYQEVSYNGFSVTALIGAILPLIPGALAWFLFTIYRIRIYYNQFNFGKTIRLDDEKSELQISYKGQTTVITKNDIKDVLIYSPWSIFSLYHFPGCLKINLANGQFIVITCFLATSDDLLPLLEDTLIITKPVSIRQIRKDALSLKSSPNSSL